MGKKGLCDTCMNDKDCTFPRRLPVIYCEEFGNGGQTSRHSKKSKAKK
jgi:hypothetical protein